MGLFDVFTDAVSDIGGAIGGVVSDAEALAGTIGGAVSSVASNPFVSFGLNAAGSLFGDPGLGSQVLGVSKALGSIFGGKPSPQVNGPVPRGFQQDGGKGRVPFSTGMPVFKSGVPIPQPASLHKVRFHNRDHFLTDLQAATLATAIRRAIALRQAKIDAARATDAVNKIQSVDATQDPGHEKEARLQLQQDVATADLEKQLAVANNQPPPTITVIAQHDVVPTPPHVSLVGPPPAHIVRNL